MSSNSPGGNDEDEPNRHPPPARPPDNNDGEETNGEEAAALDNEGNADPNPNVGDVAVVPDQQGDSTNETGAEELIMSTPEFKQLIKDFELTRMAGYNCGKCGAKKVQVKDGVHIPHRCPKLEARVKKMMSKINKGGPKITRKQVFELIKRAQKGAQKGQLPQGRKRKGRGSYNCGRCGALKKGHSCPYKKAGEEDDRKPAAKPSTTVAPPTSGGEEPPTTDEPPTEETATPEPPLEEVPTPTMDRESTNPAAKLDEASDRKRAPPTEEEGSRKESKTEHASPQEETEGPTSESAVVDVESPTEGTLDPTDVDDATSTNPAPSTETRSHQDDETDDDIEPA